MKKNYGKAIAIFIAATFLLTLFPASFSADDGEPDPIAVIEEPAESGEAPAPDVPEAPPEAPAPDAPEETEPAIEPEAEALIIEEAAEVMVEEESGEATLTLHKNDGTGEKLVVPVAATAGAPFTFRLPEKEEIVGLNTNVQNNRYYSAQWSNRPEGYHIGGWYTATECPEGSAPYTGRYSVTGNTDLYIQWTKIPDRWVTIHIQVNGVPQDDIELLRGTEILPQLPAVQPAEEGGTVEWYIVEQSDPAAQRYNRLYSGQYAQYTFTLNTLGALDPEEEEPEVPGETASITYQNWHFAAQKETREYETGSVTLPGHSDFDRFQTKYATTFRSWNTEPDATGDDYAPGDSFNLKEDVTLYAIFTGKVTYSTGGMLMPLASGNGISSSWETVSETVVLGVEMDVRSINDALFSGWTLSEYNPFLGWANAQGFGANNERYSADTDFGGDKITFTSDKSLYANFDPAVTFHLNGLDGKYETVHYTVPYKQDVSLPAITSGTFAGWSEAAKTAFSLWNTQREGKNDNYLDGQTVNLDRNLILYGIAKPPAKAVTFHSNSSPTDAKTTSLEFLPGDGVPALGDAAFKAAAFSQNLGWSVTFAGWNTKADGSGDYYGGAKGVATFTDVPSDLYAIRTTTINYDQGGYRGAYKNNVVEEVMINFPHAVRGIGDALFSHWGGRSTNTFLGWNTSQYGRSTGKAFSPDASYGADTVTLTGPMQLYAIYNPDINFEQGGVGGWDKTIFWEVPYNQEFQLPGMDDAMFAGWSQTARDKFAGWSTKLGATGQAMYLPGQTMKLDANLKLYAVGGPDEVKVTFHRNWQGSSAKSSATVKVGTAAPDISAFNGWKPYPVQFAGWNTKADGSGTYYGGSFNGQAGKANLDATVSDLYAIWKINVKYYQTGMGGGWGVYTDPTEYIAGTEITALGMGNASLNAWQTEWNQFLFWSSNQTTDVTLYDAGASLGKLWGNTQLYARYTPSLHYLQNGNGGWGSQRVVVPYGEPAAISGADGFGWKISDAKVFGGWAVKGKPDAGLYNPDATLGHTTITTTTNLELLANWVTADELEDLRTTPDPDPDDGGIGVPEGTTPAPGGKKVGSTSSANVSEGITVLAQALAEVAAPATPATEGPRQLAERRVNEAAEGLQTTASSAEWMDSDLVPETGLKNLSEAPLNVLGGVPVLLIGLGLAYAIVFFLLLARRRKDEDEAEAEG